MTSHADGSIFWKHLGARYKYTCIEAFVNVIWRDLAALFAQGMFIKQVLGHAILRSTHATQVGHPVCQFFDGLHLLIQVVSLNEVAHLK